MDYTHEKVHLGSSCASGQLTVDLMFDELYFCYETRTPNVKSVFSYTNLVYMQLGCF